MEVFDFTRDQLNRSSGIIIYGAGVWGKIVFETLREWNGMPKYFVDKYKYSDSKDSEDSEGIPILNPEELYDYLEYDVLICAPSAFEEVRLFLEKEGFQRAYHIMSLLREAKPKTFKNLQDRLPPDKLVEIYTYYMLRASGKYQNLMIPQLSFSITEACSLKCEKCNTLVPYYCHPEIFPFEKYLPEMNRMLDVVDEIMEIGFIGGEPFLNKELYKYLEWAIASDKIVSILIVTNSTIMPDKKTIEYMKNEKVYLCLDNYGEVSVKLKELEEMAIREKIDYYILNNEYWYDFGGIERKKYTIEQKRTVFTHCPIRDCNFFIKGRLYRCSLSAALSNLGYCMEEEDCVDFSQNISKDMLYQKLKVLLTERDFLEACDFCNDMERKHVIPVAVQTRK